MITLPEVGRPTLGSEEWGILAGILVGIHEQMELKRSAWSSLSAFVITNVMRILLHSEAALPSLLMKDHEPE